MQLESTEPSVSDSEPAAAVAVDEGPWVLSEEEMGESGFQFKYGHLLALLIGLYFRQQGKRFLVGGNQFICYRRGDRRAKVSPDVYVIEDDRTRLVQVKSWKVWERHLRPTLAVEIVSEEYPKDYGGDMIERYEALGVKELFRYDPYFQQGAGRIEGERALLTHFVRSDEGRLVARPLSHPRRAQSVQYGFWLVCRPDRSLRVGVGKTGRQILATPVAQARAEIRKTRRQMISVLRVATETQRSLRATEQRLRAEAERAQAEAERAQAEAERARCAEEELQRLRAELAQLKGAGSI